MAQKLNVATVLEGSVRKSGKRVRITAQLIQAASDSHLWSETYAAQAEAEVQAASTGRGENLEAYRLYLQGRFFLERMTEELSRAASATSSRRLRWTRDSRWRGPVFRAATGRKQASDGGR